MTKTGFSSYALMLSIVLWGTLLGGIAYSHLVYFPVYLSALPESAVLVNGPYGLNEGRFWMTIHPLVILSLIVSLALNWRHRPRRKLVLLTLSIYVVILVITQMYFLPELFAFANSPQSSVSAAEWLARGNRWQQFSWARGAVMFVLIFPLLFALAEREE